jgi:hypothetical protein
MKRISTSLPLPAQAMVEFFKDKKGIEFDIDYEQSVQNLRTPQAVLTYIANLKLVCNLSIEKVPAELLKAYISMRDVVQVEQLTKVHANLLYFCKYGEVLYEDELASFDFNDMVQFVADNGPAIYTQLTLLNSIPLFVETARSADPDRDRSDHPAVRFIDDATYPEISVNLFQLFTLDTFLISFLEDSAPLEEQVYFKAHYENNMYAGKTMFASFASPDNAYFALCHQVTLASVSGVERFKLANAYLKALEVTNPEQAATELQSAEAAGGLNRLLNITRKDQAIINRRIRQEKKRVKKILNQ